MLSVAAVVLTASMVVGQAQPSDQIKALGWMIGDWKGADTAEEDIAGIVAKGEKLAVSMSFNWVLDKAKIKWDLEIKGASGGTYKGIAIMGQDKEGKLKHWWFDNVAFQTPDVAEWSNDGDTWTFRSESSGSAWVLAKVSNDSMTIAETRREGQDVAKPKPVKYERVSRK